MGVASLTQEAAIVKTDPSQACEVPSTFVAEGTSHPLLTHIPTI